MLLIFISVIIIIIYLLPLVRPCNKDRIICVFTNLIISGIIWSIAMMRINKSIICFLISCVIFGLSLFTYIEYMNWYSNYENLLINNETAALNYLKSKNLELTILILIIVIFFIFYVAVSLLYYK